MRHYEIVIMIHPDQSEQVSAMLDKYRSVIEEKNGQIHRLEDWGRRQLAYQINKLHKAHYILMNVECNQEALDELEAAFRFNDAVIRHLILAEKEAVTIPSPLFKDKDRKKFNKPRSDSRDSNRTDSRKEETEVKKEEAN